MNRSVQGRRCVRHPQREAAGLCQGCGGAFCRECLVEHEGRLLCAPCLARLTSAAVSTGPSLSRRLAGWVSALAAAGALWIVFYGAEAAVATWRR